MGRIRGTKLKPVYIDRMDGRVERVCKCGTGHPIKALTEKRVKWQDWMGVHGCCGCCGPWEEEA